MIFQNTEEAQMFGKTASIEQLIEVKEKLQLLTVEFLLEKNNPGFFSNEPDQLNKMMEIATRRQFCREALESADVVLD